MRAQGRSFSLEIVAAELGVLLVSWSVLVYLGMSRVVSDEQPMPLISLFFFHICLFIFIIIFITILLPYRS